MTIYEKELQSLKTWDEVQGTSKDETTGLDFIGTAGHGYLVVPKSNKDANKAKAICHYGFTGHYAYYLEEDCEFFEFLKATDRM